MTDPDPIDGEHRTADTCVDMPVRDVAAKINTSFFEADTFWQEHDDGSGIRLLASGAMDPILITGVIDEDGDEMTTAMYLTPEQCRSLGETLEHVADTIDERKAESKTRNRAKREERKGVLGKALEVFK